MKSVLVIVSVSSLSLWCGSMVSGVSAGTVAHWKFDEGSGQYANSEGDVDNHQQLVLGPSVSTASDPAWVSPGRDGTGSMLQFVNTMGSTEGSRDFLVPSPAATPDTFLRSDFTVEAWVNLASVPPAGFSDNSPYTVLHVVGDSGGIRTNYELRFERGADADHAKLVGLFQDAGGANRALAHSIEIVAGSWHHVAFGHDSTQNLSRIWVDGIEVQSIQINDPNASLTNPRLAIGAQVRSNGRFRSFDGLLDEVRISDQLLQTSDLLVPEPHSLALLLLAGLGVGRRVRGNQA